MRYEVPEPIRGRRAGSCRLPSTARDGSQQTSTNIAWFLGCSHKKNWRMLRYNQKTLYPCDRREKHDSSRLQFAPFLPRIFGYSLAELMERQQSTSPHLLVPQFLVTVINMLREKKGEDPPSLGCFNSSTLASVIEGIFRYACFDEHILPVSYIGYLQMQPG